MCAFFFLRFVVCTFTHCDEHCSEIYFSRSSLQDQTFCKRQAVSKRCPSVVQAVSKRSSLGFDFQYEYNL